MLLGLLGSSLYYELSVGMFSSLCYITVVLNLLPVDCVFDLLKTLGLTFIDLQTPPQKSLPTGPCSVHVSAAPLCVTSVIPFEIICSKQCMHLFAI